MSLTKRLLSSLGKDTASALLCESEYATKNVLASTGVKVINLMLYGELDGGITSGITMVVGDSKTFKTLYCIQAVKAYLDTYDDAMCLFFDCERGAAEEYFLSAGVDTSRVIHVVFDDVEQLKFSLTPALNAIEKTEKIIVFIDSVSQTPSKREVDNAIDGNGAADMSRAAALNSFWRVITPILNRKHIPLFAVNSYYDDISNKYAEKIIKGGKQGYLSSENILIVTRSQEKDADKNLVGFTFNYRVLKGRGVKEGSKFPLTVTFDGGINKYSGIFELAKDAGIIIAPKQGWYQLTVDIGLDNTKSYRRSDLDCDEVLSKICDLEAFKIYCMARYKLNYKSNMVVDEETGEIIKRG